MPRLNVEFSGRSFTFTLMISPGAIVVGLMVTEAAVATGTRRRSRIKTVPDLFIWKSPFV